MTVASERSLQFETLTVRKEGAVLFAAIAAHPMNLMGPGLVRDLISLIQQAEMDETVRVLVFTSGDPDYFISHVDVTQIKEYRDEAAKLVGEPSIGLLFRYLSASRLVSIAQIEGRARGAGSEFVLACDMRFAARESAILSQPELGLGSIPGAGGVQHLTRLLGRGRALEVMLSAEDYDAELAERYGWINRALPAAALAEFVRALGHRIASFPAVAQAALKQRVNAIALASVDDFRRDSALFGETVRLPEAHSRQQAAIRKGFQTRDAEKNLARMLSNLAESDRRRRQKSYAPVAVTWARRSSSLCCARRPDSTSSSFSRTAAARANSRKTILMPFGPLRRGGTRGQERRQRAWAELATYVVQQGKPLVK